jgi:quercetin dioxygenase-like cupin family protein
MTEYINRNMQLSKEIEYSAGSIVSKIIYKNEHTILTLFSLDAGQTIAEHLTPFDAMVQVLEGMVELTIGGVKTIVSAGESIIMPANIPHALLAVTSYKMLLVMMKG